MPEHPPYQVPTMAQIRALPSNGYRVVSTFAGCGGSSTGYRMAGFPILWASEFIEAARDSYRANAAPTTIIDDRDIRDVPATDILTACGLAVGELDVLDGSPPCASFSVAGRRQHLWGETKNYSGVQQRTDDLFAEYIRLVDGIRPRVFVAENVKGLVSGVAKGHFKKIMTGLRGCGYNVAARVCDAQWLGVPQARTRLIFIGVREDLPALPAHPPPLPYRYTVREVLPHLDGQGANNGFTQAPKFTHTDRPSPTIGADPQSGNSRSAPSLVYDTGGHFNRVEFSDRPCTAILTASHQYQVHGMMPGSPVTDPETGFTLTLPTASARAHLPVRRLTLEELRVLCGFPADFILTGTYAQRWERLGRAVPPVMMSHIAACVRDNILRVIDG